MKAQQNNKKYKLASRGYFIPGYILTSRYYQINYISR